LQNVLFQFFRVLWSLFVMNDICTFITIFYFNRNFIFRLTLPLPIAYCNSLLLCLGLSLVRNKWISKYNQTCVWNFPFLEWIQVYCFCIVIKLNRKHLKIQGNVHGLRFDWLEYWLCTYFACELRVVFGSYLLIVPFSLSWY
jgi:hypothetical protein